ncbi:hypothetical protein FHX37_3217 [Haloactinospora alba]|uniref:Uncharacterized protein n=1 Tax=Haloactinospora alba TaxID=405555 RepID=A0A543NN13_9ACTN|nr:hypothetical protein FHX37_3217 [Haloactinospora alba]
MLSSDRGTRRENPRIRPAGSGSNSSSGWSSSEGFLPAPRPHDRSDTARLRRGRHGGGSARGDLQLGATQKNATSGIPRMRSSTSSGTATSAPTCSTDRPRRCWGSCGMRWTPCSGRPAPGRDAAGPGARSGRTRRARCARRVDRLGAGGGPPAGRGPGIPGPGPGVRPPDRRADRPAGVRHAAPRRAPRDPALGPTGRFRSPHYPPMPCVCAHIVSG